MEDNLWSVYIIETVGGKFYTGIAKDHVRRFWEHATDSKRGAKFFRSDPPAKLIHLEKYPGRSVASKREYEIKSMSRKQKENLVLTK